MKKENRTSLYLNNMVVYGIATAVANINSFIFVFYYSRIFNPNIYGLYDLSNNFISMFAPLGMVGMGTALFRLFFDYDNLEDKKKLIMNSIYIVFITTVLICAGLILLNQQISKLFYKDLRYSYFILLGTVLMLFQNMYMSMQVLFKIRNDRKQIVSVILLTTLLNFIFNIAFFVIMKKNIQFIIVINILIALINILYCAVNNKEYLSLREKIDKKICSELLRIGIPIIPTNLAYWILGGYDRWIINKELGSSYVGLYAMGAKLASSTLILQNIFSAGWSYFAFNIMKDKDADEVYGKLFNINVLVGFSIGVFFICFSDYIFKILFSIQYFSAYKVFPIIAMGPILTILGWIGGIGITIKKNTEYTTIALVLAAVINMLLNNLLVYRYNIIGASVATFIANTFTCIFLIFFGVKMFPVKIKYTQFIIVYMSFIFIYFIKVVIGLNLILSVLVCLVCITIYMILYKEEVIFTFNKSRILLNGLKGKVKL